MDQRRLDRRMIEKILGKSSKHGRFIRAPDANPKAISMWVNCFRVSGRRKG